MVETFTNGKARRRSWICTTYVIELDCYTINQPLATPDGKFATHSEHVKEFPKLCGNYRESVTLHFDLFINVNLFLRCWSGILVNFTKHQTMVSMIMSMIMATIRKSAVLTSSLTD